PSYFVEMERIPLTPNGKIDREVLPAPEVKPQEVYAAPRDEIEEKLVEIWTGVLGRKTSPGDPPSEVDGYPKIGINDNFFELGGHSLKATMLAALIQRTLGADIPLGDIFKTPTIRQLARFIKDAVREQYTAIKPIENREYYALSSAQKRLYFLQQTDKTTSAYNMPFAHVVEGSLNLHRLEYTFKSL
ncbi:MAG: hypothetical protein GY950_18730, partial [bacterium]|nr:hypothetical protein [bacterium]